MRRFMQYIPFLVFFEVIPGYFWNQNKAFTDFRKNIKMLLKEKSVNIVEEFFAKIQQNKNFILSNLLNCYHYYVRMNL